MIRLTEGSGRTRLQLRAQRVGPDWLVLITGGGAHVGAAALGAMDMGRASSSVLTVPGHRDDRLAGPLAERVSREVGGTSLVVAGVHLDDITDREIREVLANGERLVERFIERIRG